MIIFYFKRLLIYYFVSSLLFSCPYSQNLVSNSGGDTCLLTPWTSTGSQTSGWAISGSVPHTGPCYFATQAYFGLPLQQSITGLEAGKTYLLSFWAMKSSVGYYNLTVYIGEKMYMLESLLDDYQRYSEYFLAPSTSATISFYSSGTCGIDDISVFAVTSIPTIISSWSPTMVLNKEPKLHKLRMSANLNRIRMNAISTNLQQGLLAAYLFSGNANDESGHGSNGVVANGATAVDDRFGVPAAAYTFNGVSGYIITSGTQFTFSQDLSISLWIAPTNFVGRVIDHSSSPNTGLNMAYVSSSLVVTYYTSGVTSVFSGLTLQLNQWNHVVFVKSGTTLTSYLNTAAVASTSGSGTISPNTNIDFVLGANKAGLEYIEYMSGALDDVFIYNRALTVAEISQLFLFGAPSAAPTPVPSAAPTFVPTVLPSRMPSAAPSSPSSQPTSHPTVQPSIRPSLQPIGCPSGQPSSSPTRQPSSDPSSYPSRHPYSAPSAQPSSYPSRQPIAHPTGQPSSRPSFVPSRQPSSYPTNQPSGQPSSVPSPEPSSKPSILPSSVPTIQPVSQPSSIPTRLPTAFPSTRPSVTPSTQPSSAPTIQPTAVPSAQPNGMPTVFPTTQPSSRPSNQPSGRPSSIPSVQPSSSPSGQPSSIPSAQPNSVPTSVPSNQPSSLPSGRPSGSPSTQPSSAPSGRPSSGPSVQPSSIPTGVPSCQPSSMPSSQPSGRPSSIPSTHPSSIPSGQPSSAPSAQPSSIPTGVPSCQPSSMPSSQPSGRPSSFPSTQPSSLPSGLPSSAPSVQPSSIPTGVPSCQPSSMPSSQPSGRPSSIPSTQPSSLPSGQPSAVPSARPGSIPTGVPTQQPSSVPSVQPSSKPSGQPSSIPSIQPSDIPTGVPTGVPTMSPSSMPSVQPSRGPSSIPSVRPSSIPSDQPSLLPSAQPSRIPTGFPTNQPSSIPSNQPTVLPSSLPSSPPTIFPSATPSNRPSSLPSSSPSAIPSTIPSVQPSLCPTCYPSSFPSTRPSAQPFSHPSSQPTVSPTLDKLYKSTNNISLAMIGFPGPIKEKLFVFGYHHNPHIHVNTALVEVVYSTFSSSSSSSFIGNCHVIYGNANLSSEMDVSMFHDDDGYLEDFFPIDNVMMNDEIIRSVDSTININGDFHNDVILGYPLESTVYVFFGNRKGMNDLTAGFIVKASSSSTSSDDYFGWSVAGMDYDGDGVDEIISCALLSSRCYLIYGRKDPKSFPSIINYSNETEFRRFGFIIKTSDEGGNAKKILNLGLALSSAGDMNNDGKEEIIVSAMNNGGKTMLFLLYGRNISSSPFPVSDIVLSFTLPAELGVVLVAPDYSFLGISLSNLGDVNNDGYDDIIIGSLPYENGKYAAQVSYLVFGEKNLSYLSSVFFLNQNQNEGKGTVKIKGGGFQVSGMGDVNGDGYNDVLVVDYGDWSGRSSAYLLALPSLHTFPSSRPSSSPVVSTTSPSVTPSRTPSSSFPTRTSLAPSVAPVGPSIAPSFIPSFSPTVSPTYFPSLQTPLPTVREKKRSRSPSETPSLLPTLSPSVAPTIRLTRIPTTTLPTLLPSFQPSYSPSISSTASGGLPAVPDNLLKIDNGGIYRPNPQVNSIVINSPTDVIIASDSSVTSGDNSPSKKRYIISQQSNMTITISCFFNISSDILDFASFFSASSYQVFEDPLTFLFPNHQKIILSSIASLNDLPDKSIIFPSTVGNEGKKQNDPPSSHADPTDPKGTANYLVTSSSVNRLDLAWFLSRKVTSVIGLFMLLTIFVCCIFNLKHCLPFRRKQNKKLKITAAGSSKMSERGKSTSINLTLVNTPNVGGIVEQTVRFRAVDIESQIPPSSSSSAGSSDDGNDSDDVVESNDNSDRDDNSDADEDGNEDRNDSEEEDNEYEGEDDGHDDESDTRSEFSSCSFRSFDSIALSEEGFSVSHLRRYVLADSSSSSSSNTSGSSSSSSSSNSSGGYSG
jgi:hypothetical protein